MKTLKRGSLAAIFALAIAGITACDTPFRITTGITYENPGWAPPYYSGARYYYFPDIETYYDLSDHSFVYLDNGQWLYAPTLPPVYSGFDLFTGFVITLNINVFEPWKHHHYYVAHYPRYYYRNVYHDKDFSLFRGFNENNHDLIRWKPGEKERIRDLRNLPQPPRKPQVQKPPEGTHYYGKPVGQPVRVTPRMKQKDNKPTPREPSQPRGQAPVRKEQ